MTNPFEGRRAAPETLNNSFRGMVPGETRTVHFKDGSSKTITRTKRPFIADWVDSTNGELAARSVPYLRWVFVDGYEMPPSLVDTRYVRAARLTNQTEAQKLIEQTAGSMKV